MGWDFLVEMAPLAMRFVSALLPLHPVLAAIAAAIPATPPSGLTRPSPNPLNARQYEDAPQLSVSECIEKSLSSPSWNIISPMLVTINAPKGGTMGDIQFYALNMATGTTALCDQRDIDLDPRGPGSDDIWHACNVTDVAFQFNLTSFVMKLKGSWVCGKDSPWDTPIFRDQKK